MSIFGNNIKHNDKILQEFQNRIMMKFFLQAYSKFRFAQLGFRRSGHIYQDTAAKYSKCRHATDKYALYKNQQNALLNLVLYIFSVFFFLMFFLFFFLQSLQRLQ